MGLIRFGDCIELTDIRNSTLSFTCENLKGLSINKNLIPTKANTNELDLKNYKIVRHNEFTYSTVTSRNGNKISVAYNDSYDCIVSSINPTFKVKDESKLLPRFLMMFFNRSEFDRYARFNSWGSARETFTWEDMCDIELDLPPIEIQRKYVAIYEGLLANLHSYENKLEDLKLVCDAYIEDLRKKYPLQTLSRYINLVDLRNSDNKIKLVKSVSTSKIFTEVSSKVNKNDLKRYKIVKPNQISYVQTTHNEKVFAFAINNTNQDIVVTDVNNVLNTNDNYLNPYYLSIWFKRTEFDRYARYTSWGSAREIISWDTICEYKIPIPPLEIQNAIVEVFNVYNERKEYVNRLKNIIKDICPLLVRGAIKEASEVK